MAIWSRDKQFGGGSGAFNNADGADNDNNNSIVPTTTRFGMIFSNILDNTLNRSKWLCTALYRSLQSQLHKEEDRATGANIGVTGTGIESTQTVYVTPEQLPIVEKLTNDFTVSAIETDGNLTNNQDMFSVSVINADRKNKSFKIKFSDFGVKWLLARTFKQSDITTLISTTINNPSDGSGIIPVGTEFDRSSLDDPTGYLNLCVGDRTIAKASASVATLKDDKYKNLFVFLYINYFDSLCPVSGGRGGVGSVAANLDWEAGKNIKLPDYRGRIAGYYKSGDSDFQTMGNEFGHNRIYNSHLPINSPWTINDPQHSHSLTSMGGVWGDTPGGGETSVTSTGNSNTNSSSTNITLNQNIGGEQLFYPRTKVTARIIKY